MQLHEHYNIAATSQGWPILSDFQDVLGVLRAGTQEQKQHLTMLIKTSPLDVYYYDHFDQLVKSYPAIAALPLSHTNQLGMVRVTRAITDACYTKFDIKLSDKLIAYWLGIGARHVHASQDHYLVKAMWRAYDKKAQLFDHIGYDNGAFEFYRQWIKDSPQPYQPWLGYQKFAKQFPSPRARVWFAGITHGFNHRYGGRLAVPASTEDQPVFVELTTLLAKDPSFIGIFLDQFDEWRPALQKLFGRDVLMESDTLKDFNRFYSYVDEESWVWAHCCADYPPRMDLLLSNTNSDPFQVRLRRLYASVSTPTPLKSPSKVFIIHFPDWGSVGFRFCWHPKEGILQSDPTLLRFKDSDYKGSTKVAGWSRRVLPARGYRQSKEYNWLKANLPEMLYGVPFSKKVDPALIIQLESFIKK